MSTSLKLEGLHNLCRLAITTKYRLIYQYRNQTFPGTNISKIQLFANILADDLSKEQSDYLQSVCSIPNRDSRTPQEYAKELVIGWLIEDATEALFARYGMNLKKSGSDKNREFLSEGMVTAETDYKIHFNDQIRHMEFAHDYTGHWQRTGSIDLRHNKHNHLKENEALLFCMSTTDMQAAIFDYSDVVDAVQEMHPVYQKPVMSIKNVADRFMPLDEVLRRTSSGIL